MMKISIQHTYPPHPLKLTSVNFIFDLVRLKRPFSEMFNRAAFHDVIQLLDFSSEESQLST